MASCGAAGMAGFGEERRGLSRQARQARRGREWFGRSWAAGMARMARMGSAKFV